MEKLIELLNEYGTQKKANANWKEFLEEEKNQIYLIFGMDFVKWLVENDKIDTDAYKTVYSEDLDKWKTLTMSSGGDEFYQVTEHGVYESLLMLLSISDTPIEDLISYLK